MNREQKNTSEIGDWSVCRDEVRYTNSPGSEGQNMFLSFVKKCGTLISFFGQPTIGYKIVLHHSERILSLSCF